MLKIAFGEAAAALGKTLLVADLHLGIELELRAKGISARQQWQPCAKRINALLKKMRCNSLVILGDAKHDVYGCDIEERTMFRHFLDALATKDVRIIKGNHDSHLEGTAPIIPATGMLFDDAGVSYGLFHGHAWPSKGVLQSDILLMAHQHPMYEFKDRAGSWSEKCWISAETKADKKQGVIAGRRVVIFPAFGLLSGGIRLNSERGIGPFFENRLLRKMTAFSLEGAPLGALPSQRS
ncbi:MAG: metallophosphoesterase [Candidatus Micrarchaeota archaeon]